MTMRHYLLFWPFILIHLLLNYYGKYQPCLILQDFKVKVKLDFFFDLFNEKNLHLIFLRAIVFHLRSLWLFILHRVYMAILNIKFGSICLFWVIGLFFVFFSLAHLDTFWDGPGLYLFSPGFVRLKFDPTNYDQIKTKTISLFSPFKKIFPKIHNIDFFI